MASGHGLIWEQQILAAKVESVAGTAVTLAAVDGALNAFNQGPSILPRFGANERKAQGSMSQMKSVPGGRAAEIKATIEMANDGAANAPLWMSTFLAAAGLNFSTGVSTVQSGSSSAVSITVGQYIDGLLFQGAGAMFDMEATFESGKTVPMVFSGQAVWQAPTDVALIAPTYPTNIPPIFQGATFTVGGTSYVSPRAVLRLGNQVQLRPDGNSAFGYKAAYIASRKVTWEIDVEAALLATKNWYTDFLASTEVALSLAIGSGTNNIITCASPKLQIAEPPEPVVTNGLLYYRLKCQANKSAAAGDDELTITAS